jgi:nucleotide-binding universal stress UspA family protein
MYQKIVVPLDGSSLAEQALPYAEEIAKGCSIHELILLSVTEKVSGQTWAPESRANLAASDNIRLGSGMDTYSVSSASMPPVLASPVAPEGFGTSVKVTFGKMEKQAQKYLAKMVKELAAKGIPARAEVLIGSPAAEIVDYAQDNSADLIVMSSHGRSGPSRLAWGSVADKVFRTTCVPVLMVRAKGCGPI